MASEIGTSNPDYLPRLLAFVASHDMENPRIEGDAVVFGIASFHADKGRGPTEWVTVRTVRQARNALGY